MGTWGVGPFENDHASDLACEIDGVEALERPVLVESALLAALEQGCSAPSRIFDQAVAAAAIVASQCPGGSPVDSVYGPEEVIPDVHGSKMVELAIRVIVQALSEHSSVSRLWGETSSLRAWEGALGELLSVLRNA
ncbi:DUF4259 domain-containing protein [Actinomadura viridis]|uniref:DUF4259 domain-containing protein n=1 Tax=Actinomadura viridis TaxID=58110 RepID=UPI00368B9A1F